MKTVIESTSIQTYQNELQQKKQETGLTYLKALSAHPENSENYSKLLHLLYSLQPESAFNFLLQYQTLISDSVSLQLKLAEYFQCLGCYNKALYFYKSAIICDPDCENIHSQIGNFYKNNGLLQKALIHFRKSFQLTPDNCTLLCNYIDVLYLLKDFNTISLVLEEVESENLYLEETEIVLGRIRFRIGQYVQALRHFEKAITENPDNLDLLHEFGTCLCILRRFSDAANIFLRIKKMDPYFNNSFLKYRYLLNCISEESEKNFSNHQLV